MPPGAEHGFMWQTQKSRFITTELFCHKFSIQCFSLPVFLIWFAWKLLELPALELSYAVSLIKPNLEPHAGTSGHQLDLNMQFTGQEQNGQQVSGFTHGLWFWASHRGFSKHCMVPTSAVTHPRPSPHGQVLYWWPQDTITYSKFWQRQNWVYQHQRRVLHE